MHLNISNTYGALKKSIMENNYRLIMRLVDKYIDSLKMERNRKKFILLFSTIIFLLIVFKNTNDCAKYIHAASLKA
jgi:hypothetical protein